MKFWDKLGRTGKAAAAITSIITLVVMIGGGIFMLQTDAEAEEWRQGHKLSQTEKAQADKYQRADRELKRLQLTRFGEDDLSQKKKDILDLQIEEYIELKKCIKRNEC